MKDNPVHGDSGFEPCPTCGSDDAAMVGWGDPEGETEYVICLLYGTPYDPFTGDFVSPA